MTASLNKAGDHFKSLYAGTQKRLQEMQDTPLGTVRRTSREKNKIMERLRALPRDEKQAALSAMARQYGDDKLMEFLTEQAD